MEHKAYVVNYMINEVELRRVIVAIEATIVEGLQAGRGNVNAFSQDPEMASYIIAALRENNILIPMYNVKTYDKEEQL